MEFNFDEFKSVDVVNKKRSGIAAKEEQYTGIKWRKALSKKKVEGEEGTETIVTKFYVSKARVAELKLEENGLRYFLNKDKTAVILGVVADEHAQLLKKREGIAHKGNGFTSGVLEGILEKIGILKLDVEVGTNQFIELVPIPKEGIVLDGIPVIKAFSLKKGSAKPAATSTEEAKTETKAETAAPKVTDVPTASPAPVAQTETAPAASGDDEWK